MFSSKVGLLPSCGDSTKWKTLSLMDSMLRHNNVLSLGLIPMPLLWMLPILNQKNDFANILQQRSIHQSKRRKSGLNLNYRSSFWSKISNKKYFEFVSVWNGNFYTKIEKMDSKNNNNDSLAQKIEKNEEKEKRNPSKPNIAEKEEIDDDIDMMDTSLINNNNNNENSINLKETDHFDSGNGLNSLHCELISIDCQKWNKNGSNDCDASNMIQLLKNVNQSKNNCNNNNNNNNNSEIDNKLIIKKKCNLSDLNSIATHYSHIRLLMRLYSDPSKKPKMVPKTPPMTPKQKETKKIDRDESETLENKANDSQSLETPAPRRSERLKSKQNHSNEQETNKKANLTQIGRKRKRSELLQADDNDIPMTPAKNGKKKDVTGKTSKSKTTAKKVTKKKKNDTNKNSNNTVRKVQTKKSKKSAIPPKTATKAPTKANTNNKKSPRKSTIASKTLKKDVKKSKKNKKSNENDIEMKQSKAESKVEMKFDDEYWQYLEQMQKSSQMFSNLMQELEVNQECFEVEFTHSQCKNLRCILMPFTSNLGVLHVYYPQNCWNFEANAKTHCLERKRTIWRQRYQNPKERNIEGDLNVIRQTASHVLRADNIDINCNFVESNEFNLSSLQYIDSSMCL